MTYSLTTIMACWKCGLLPASYRRQSTSYYDDKLNFAVLCDVCQEEEYKYWQERWDEYYRECF